MQHGLLRNSWVTLRKQADNDILIRNYFPRSSSGRTADSGSAYLGSNPSLGTKIRTPLQRCFYLVYIPPPRLGEVEGGITIVFPLFAKVNLFFGERLRYLCIQ